MSLFEKLSKWNRTREKTNAASIIGKTAIVTADIDNLKETGTIQMAGLDWSARTADGKTVSKGSIVRVTAIEGVKVIVENIAEEE